MKITSILFSSLAMLVFCQNGFAIDPPNPEASATGKTAEWMKYTTPGEGHKVLNDLAGKWSYTMQWWTAPGSKPEESKGSCNSKWILGGRFLQQDVKGKAMGQPFQGMGVIGYDTFKQEYQSSWLDSMSTGMMLTTGSYDTATKTLQQTGTLSDPMSGEKNKWFRTELKIASHNEHTYLMFNKGTDGNEFKAGEIVYKRAK